MKKNLFNKKRREKNSILSESVSVGMSHCKTTITISIVSITGNGQMETAKTRQPTHNKSESNTNFDLNKKQTTK